MTPPAAGKQPAEKYEYRRSCLRDALDMQGLVMNQAGATDIGPMALAALASALCRLIPLTMALRGRPVLLSGSFTKKLDMTPKDAMKLLRSAKGPTGAIDLDKLLEEGDEPKESLKSMPKGERRVGGGEGKEGDGTS